MRLRPCGLLSSFVWCSSHPDSAIGGTGIPNSGWPSIKMSGLGDAESKRGLSPQKRKSDALSFVGPLERPTVRWTSRGIRVEYDVRRRSGRGRVGGRRSAEDPVEAENLERHRDAESKGLVPVCFAPPCSLGWLLLMPRMGECYSRVGPGETAIVDGSEASPTRCRCGRFGTVSAVLGNINFNILLVGAILYD